MRIRAIFLAVVALSFIPLTFVGVWSYRHAVENEFADSRQRNMLLAENLRTFLIQYHENIGLTLSKTRYAELSMESDGDLNRMMIQLGVRFLAKVDFQSGMLLDEYSRPDTSGGIGLNQSERLALRENAFQGATTYSQIKALSDGRTVLYALRRFGNVFSIAQIEANVFQDKANSISFGETGHVAITDRRGRVIAHPNEKLVLKAYSLSKLSPVAHTLAGKTGFVTFYSPFWKQDVLAAALPVPRSNWGIMVNEGVPEIEQRAWESQWGFLIALVIGLIMVVLVAFLIVRFFVKPLESMSAQFRTDADSGSRPAPFHGKTLPYIGELAEVHRNYNLLVKQINKAQGEIERLAYSDTVTGLANRSSFKQRFQEIVESADSSAKGCALIFIDLDNFKQVNDVHGHQSGDRLLAAVAKAIVTELEAWSSQRISKNTSEPLAARIGGDEFAILVPGLVDAAEANNLMKSVGKAVARPSTEDTQFAFVGASVGCARYPLDGETCEEILKRADMAMYKAKNAGRGQQVLYNSGHGMLTPGELRHEIANAIEQGELYLVYQPQLCAKSRRVMGVEALVRWQHPERGVQPPDLWLPEIANTSTIIELGEWVVETALSDLSHLHETGRNISAAVNIGSKHFLTPGFTDMMARLADQCGIERDRIEVEVTEDAIFQSTDHAELVLNDLRNRGFRISIDDFGRGFSNMARLADLAVDFVKIDRSIVDGAQKNPRTRSILASTISMAHELGCKTIAEGVETVRQADFTTYMGADFLQGYYFAQPMKKNELFDWLEVWEGGTISGLNRRLLESVA